MIHNFVRLWWRGLMAEGTEVDAGDVAHPLSNSCGILVK